MTSTAGTVTESDLSLLLAQVEVVSAERLSPTFLRLELGGAGLADLGVDGPLYDQRFKLVVPHEAGGLTSVEGADEGWLSTWRERPVEERGHMRTYTVREVRGTGADTRLVVDFALHDAGDHGEIGPGAGWGAQAVPGDRAVIVAPRRGHAFGGIEFAPPAASLHGTGRLLLVGDETAVPAISAILECLPAGARGAAYLEVPVDGDILDVRGPDGVEVTWLPRNGAPWGERLTPAVVEHLGAAPLAAHPAEEEVDPDLWETPTYSSSGEAIAPVQAAGRLPPAADESSLGDLYAWIAGEAAVVTGLRRHLVRELGMDRRQVAFMGYWRRGVPMRS